MKDELERLFWIEIAKRKARHLDDRVFQMMLSLSKDITEWFESKEACLSEPMDDGVDFFWNVIQFGSYDHPLKIPDEQLDLLNTAVSLFSERGREIAHRLPCYQGFLLSDFSVVSDLAGLHAWWMYVNSGEGRKDLRSKGLFSSTGEKHLVAAKEELHFAGDQFPQIRVGEEILTTIFIANPVRIPQRLTKRKFRDWSSNDHQITVNGNVLSNSFLLDFDLSKPMPKMREVELALRTAYNSERLRKMDAMLTSEIINDPSVFDNDEIGCMTKLMISPPEEHQLMVAQNSVRPLIFGLYCCDLIHAGNSKTEAANQALKDLLSNSGRQDYNLRRAQYGIEVVQEKINNYNSSILPWNS